MARMPGVAKALGHVATNELRNTLRDIIDSEKVCRFSAIHDPRPQHLHATVLSPVTVLSPLAA